MLSRNQKAAYLAVGAASTAAIIWLRYAKSAAGTRCFLADTGAKAGRALDSFRSALANVQQRLEETDRLVREIVQLGSEQRERVEAILNDTRKRLEEARELILNNVELSSKEISALLGDIRAAFQRLAAAKSIRAA